MTGPSPAVALSAPPRPEKKRKAPIAPWIAAAAVVALGVTVSVATLNTADEAPAVGMSAPQAEQAPGMFPAAPSAEPALPEEPMEMAEAEEADDYETGPMEEAATEALADEAPTASAAAETTEGNLGAARRRTSRASGMAAAMTSTRAPSVLDTASGAAPPPAMAQGAGGAAQDDRQVAVERSKAGVRACLGAGADSAVVMVRFRDGAVRDARLVRPAGNDATNECVASALRRARIRPEGQQERRTLYYRWGASPSNAYR